MDEDDARQLMGPDDSVLVLGGMRACIETLEDQVVSGMSSSMIRSPWLRAVHWSRAIIRCTSNRLKGCSAKLMDARECI